MQSRLGERALSLPVLLGIPSQAKYGIFNDRGEQVYYAFEGSRPNAEREREREEISTACHLRLESDVCQRMCCPANRRFDLHIVDRANQVRLAVVPCHDQSSSRKSFVSNENSNVGRAVAGWLAVKRAVKK